MMRFDQLPEYGRELLALWAILLLLFLYYVLAQFIQQRRRKERFFLTGLLVAADYVLLQIMLDFVGGQPRRDARQGICASSLVFAPFANGLPKLTNDRMDALCRTITGASLGDADAFWNVLREGRVQTGITSIQTGESPIIRLPVGTYTAFGAQSSYWRDSPSGSFWRWM